MATRTITTRLALEGEAEYRAALKNINSDLTLHKSELEKVTAQYQSNANSAEALRAKQSALEQTMSALTEKHRAQNQMLEQAKKAQEQYRAQVETLRKTLSEYSSTADRSSEKEKELSDELKQAEENLQKAGNAVSYYQKQINYTERDQAELNTQLDENARYLSEAENAADQCATSIDQYGKKVEQAGSGTEQAGAAVEALATALVASGLQRSLQEIASALSACVDASIEFESAITGVYKTVDGTEEQLAAISDGIKQMSTEIPATTTEIASVAEAAGQLGIATDDVLDFTRVMIDLGVSTNLSADEAASSLAKFANITGTAADDYQRLGSVIVGLGNNFATTEADVVAMSTRLASAGTLAGLTESEILALATAMSSVGIEAEAGGTAMTQTLTAIETAVAEGGDSLTEFARIAGMSAGEFAEQWEASPITALQAFIAGLGDLDAQGESATLVLEDLGLSGVRQSNMLKSLALASDTLSDAVGMANQAWAENVALTEESEKFYGTTENRLQTLSNSFAQVKVAIGDVLTPALGKLADAGADALDWAAEFIEDNPWLVSAISAVAASVGVLTAAISAYTVVTKAVIPLISSFNAALAANPIGAVAVGVTALVAGLGTLVATLKRTAEEAEDPFAGLTSAQRELLESIEQSRQAWADERTAMSEQEQSVSNLIGTIETLAAAEDKTATEKAMLKSYVDELNEAVPNLSLAYDEQTDSLNMTAAAVRDLALAELEREKQAETIDRLKELYTQNEELEEQRQQLIDDLRIANEELTRFNADANFGAANDATEVIKTLQEQINALNAEVVENNREINSLTVSYDDYTDSAQTAVETTEEATATLEELLEAADDLTAGTGALTSASDDLTAALEEQSESGSLSIDTILDLIDNGYALALQIDEETGAVTLNRDAYVSLTQAKIQERIAALQTDRNALINALGDEESAATGAYTATIALASGRYDAAIAAWAEAEAAAGQVAAYDTQIASLRALKNQLGTVTVAVSSASSSAARASASVKTQAQKDLETFRDLRDEYDYLLDMGEIAEEDYYKKLAELRDQYLTDDDNLDEYRKINKEIYKYDKQLAAQEDELWEEQTEALADALDDRLSEVLDLQADMESRLASYGDLYTETDFGITLNDLQAQIDAMERYGEIMEQLSEQNISQSLLDEIAAMDIDEAIGYGTTLLGLTPEALEEYVALWDEKQKKAVEISTKYYKSEVEAAEKEFRDEFEKTLSDTKDSAFAGGENTVQALIDGLKSKMPELSEAVAELYARMQPFLTADDTEVDGSHAAGLSYVPYDGYIAELHRGERILSAAEAQAYVASAMPRTLELTQNQQSEEMVAALVNGFAGAVSQAPAAQSAEPIQIDIRLPDGTKLASAVYDPLKKIKKQKGD